MIWFTKELSGTFDLEKVNPASEEVVSKENLGPCIEGSLFENQDFCMEESLKRAQVLLLSRP